MFNEMVTVNQPVVVACVAGVIVVGMADDDEDNGDAAVAGNRSGTG